jgi:hypothetical protein
MAVSLRGQAQGVLGNLPLELRQDYKELVKSLEERFIFVPPCPCCQRLCKLGF